VNGYDGIEILEHGLPELPKTLDYSQSVPVAYWKGEVLGTVLFLYYLRDRDGDPRPRGFSGTYVRAGEGWQPRKRWTPNDGARIDFDPITSIESTDYGGSAIHWTGGRHTSEPEEDEPAILISGRHAPNVAEIRFIQGEVLRQSRADGHFGFWTICSDAFEPFRIEAHDSEGALVGFFDNPLHLELHVPQPSPLEVVTPEDADLPHQYGGRIQILGIERYEAKVVVEWHITLEPDPDVQLAEQLEALDREPDQAWTLERIEEHIKLIDVLKLTVFFSHLSLTDDLGTVYQGGGGGGSTGQGEGTWSHEFEPAIPDEATTLTVHWEDLSFQIPLR
jgi:hypothetical protein